MNLSGIVGRMSTHTITIRRYAANTVVAGVVSAGALASTASARASVQPVTGPELERLPEGVRVDDSRLVHCATELRLNDRITIDGVIYSVEDVTGRAGFWRAIAVKV